MEAKGKFYTLSGRVKLKNQTILLDFIMILGKIKPAKLWFRKSEIIAQCVPWYTSTNRKPFVQIKLPEGRWPSPSLLFSGWLIIHTYTTKRKNSGPTEPYTLIRPHQNSNALTVTFSLSIVLQIFVLNFQIAFCFSFVEPPSSPLGWWHRSTKRWNADDRRVPSTPL